MRVSDVVLLRMETLIQYMTVDGKHQYNIRCKEQGKNSTSIAVSLELACVIDGPG